MDKPRLLVAGTPPVIATIQDLLGDGVQCIPARCIEEAMLGIEGRPDAILCNVRFDESRMMELLSTVKEQPETRAIPFLCLRLAPMPASWRRGVEIAALALGAAGFLDFSALERERGVDAAEQALRDMVRTHLPAGRL
jgi:response regulator RpfG family c-di-GMP phosphodiesterase